MSVIYLITVTLLPENYTHGFTHSVRNVTTTRTTQHYIL